MNRPNSMASAEGGLEERAGHGEPGERAAVVVAGRGVGVEHLGQPVRAGVGQRGGQLRRLGQRRAGAEQHHGGHGQQRDRRGRHLPAAELLAQVLRGAPDHQPGQEHRDDGEHQDAVQAGPDPARRDLAEQHVQQRDPAAQPGVAVVQRVHRAGRGAGGGHREQHRAGDPEPDLLALQRRAGGQGGRAVRVRLGPPGDGQQPAPQHAHHREQHVALPACRATITPNVRVRQTGMTSSRKISIRLVQAFGFSNGCAELALKIPPPLVPSSLIASWLARRGQRDRGLADRPHR